MNAEPTQPAPLDDLAAGTPPPRPRPLVLPTLAFMAGITISEFLGAGVPRSTTLILSIVALLLLLVVATKRRGPTCLLSALIVVAALSLGYTRHQSAVYLPPDHVAHVLADEPTLSRLAGRIVTQPTMTPAEKRNPFLPTEPSARTRFVLDATELRTTDPPTPITGFVRVGVKAEGLEAAMGDTVVVTGKLYRPYGPRNPGETDWARWNRLQNVYASLSVDAAVHVRRVQTKDVTGGQLLAAMRSYVQGLLFEPFAEAETDQPLRLLDAMVLGHRSAAGRQLYEAFLRTGTLHFLTVSGFHVGVLAGAVWWVFRRTLRRGPRTAAVATMITIALYALIVEHNAPVLRAATMGILLCLAQLTRRPFCGFNWLALSALCVLTYNPLELFRAGFQLSFLQVVAIFTIVPRAYRLLVRRRTGDEVPADTDTWPGLIAHRVWRWVFGLIVICVMAWIVSLPLVLFHFGRFAPWGALQSILVSPLVVLTIVLGFFTLVAQIILPPAGAVLGFLLHGATDLLLWVVDGLSQLPGTLIEAQPPPAALVIATYALLLVCVLARPRLASGGGDDVPDKANKLKPALLLAGIIPCLWLGWLFWPPANTRGAYVVHVLSVGNGSAVLVTTPDEHALLYDVGTIHNFDAGETAVQAARVLGVHRLDAIVLSHANFDHYSGAPTALSRLPTERLVFSPYFEAAATDSPAVGQLLDLLPTESPPRSTLSAGDRFTLGTAAIEILWPVTGLDEGWECNDRSLVLRIEANRRSVLLPGDIQRDAIRALLKRHESRQIDLRSDVLIAPHHGAVLPRDTAAFHQAVQPQVVVNSTGRPRPKLRAMLRETFGDEVRLVSTHSAGAVTICITPEGEIEIETPFASPPESSSRSE